MTHADSRNAAAISTDDLENVCAVGEEGLGGGAWLNQQTRVKCN